MMGNGIRRLAAAKMALVWLALTAIVLVSCRVLGRPVGPWIAGPLAGLCLSLTASLVVSERLKRDPGLFVFHVGLALLVGLVAVGRLMAFDGHVEVTRGTTLDPAQVQGEGGPLHFHHFEEASFLQGPFSVSYARGVKRRETRSQVTLPEGRELVVGDDVPLILGGYRFYTTHNKGFAPLLAWVVGDRVETGAVHLPSYPINEFRQGLEWRLPDGSGAVTLWLALARPGFEEEASWTFPPPVEAKLVVVEATGKRHELAPGETAVLPGGRLRYESLSSWMGYRIFFDPTLPWLAVAAVVASGGLGMYALRRLSEVTGEEVRHAA
ncbi:MAG: hypothetical protein ABT940_08050 [Alphaproteobacteria bacterium]